MTAYRRTIRFAVGLAAAVALWSAGGGAAERFFSLIDDLPVMPGLHEVPGAGVVFDKPQGRIVEVTAEGAATRDGVRGFYAGVLPRLGWVPLAPGAFRREGERLRLIIEGSDGAVTVRFSLSPE